jgi:hypothetical protein
MIEILWPNGPWFSYPARAHAAAAETSHVHLTTLEPGAALAILTVIPLLVVAAATNPVQVG